ncbi:hypothetical protein [Sphingomonas sp. NPDC079357]|uniref:hypothetical protein n=1 Tax=Sphingomonas sp. NPDC079357 TaxID=3364518 RepID=UPI00384F1CE4
MADKVAAQIERLAPVAFDGAFREMTRYHRFLLALGASRDPKGAAFNFAEIAGNAWHAPHKEWIRQYRRLFERAADKLVDDSHFARSLAYVPGRLMPGPGDPEMSPNVLRAILDLGPLLVSRLEAWVTKRTTVETRQGQAAEPRLALAGSDAKAYESAIPDIVGAWESLLHYPRSMYGWRERGERTDVERWAAFRASWPFLWQHLTNTAYCLATAVWNEDETGAALFREALVRWAHAVDHRLDDRAELRHRRLLFPSILELDWPEASAKAAPLGYDYMPPPTPDQLFASVIRGAHDDTVLLTSALLLFWTINEKQASDIGARTARALLSREASDDDHRHTGWEPLSFRSLFLDLLRLEMTGERYRDGSYAAELDHSVAVLDNMTERRVVPGRVFTPSTLHGRDGLLLSDLVILLAHVPDEGDDGLKERITALAHEEDVLPEGDGSLRDILHQLERFHSTLEQPFPALDRGMQLLSPNRDPQRSKARLREIVSEIANAIEEKRRHRLQARPADPANLERLRLAIEEALLTSEVEAPFFRGVEVGRAAESDIAEWRDMTFSGIGKAQLTEPPMESPSSSFEEMLVSGSREMAGRHAWAAFCQRPRIEATVAGRAEEEAFWRDLRPLIQQVGPEPVLVVSRNAEGRALRRFLYAPAADRPGLAIEQRPRAGRGASYIATVEGVDVFGADFRPGEAWLFSAMSLREVRYAETTAPDRHAELTFELGEEMKGTLRVRVHQALKWTDTPTFELKAPDPTVEGELSKPG